MEGLDAGHAVLGRRPLTPGGELSVGAKFATRLPAASRQRSGARDEAGDGTGDSPNASLRILVVDDNVDAATTMTALLGIYGHDVRTAHDGLQALEEIGRFAPDVVILDIGLPKLNGYAVATRIRERTDVAQPLLIALTGWGQEEDRLRSKAAGFDHHLVKPVDPQALIALLCAAGGCRTIH